MCKHVAAVLYGVGARLDEQPDLLFTLRQVDAQDLISTVGARTRLTAGGQSSAKVLETGNFSELFGLQLAELSGSRVSKKVVSKRSRKVPASMRANKAPVKQKAPATKKR
ncbi:hypothetical protein BH11GEM2_BH11GEM2_13150 [soil metagenome]